MKRQSVRNGILLISFLLFPIIQFYFSPYIVVSAAAQGIINASLLMFALLFIGSIFFGRAFCGWVMPCGALQEICFKVNGNRVKGEKLNWIKFLIWIPWLILIAAFAIHAGGFKTIDPFYKIQYGVSVSKPMLFIIYYGTIAIFVALALIIGKRPACHYICWMAPFMILGRKTGNCLHLPALRLKVDPTKCRSCGECTRNCPMSLDVAGRVREGRMENAECILCGNCVDTCKEKAILYSFEAPLKNAETNGKTDSSIEL